MNQFSVPSFLFNCSFYEVNLRQYTSQGSIKAFLEHLPRIKEMGVTVLWIMPIHPIGKVNRKGTLGSYYSISDHEAINPEFGTEDDFKILVQECHKLGLKLILDWVANHCSWDHKWTESNPDFFVKSAEGEFFSPYDWTDVIQLDHSNKSQQRSMIGAMEYWVRNFDIDGFRADLAHLTPLPFWIEARSRLDGIKEGLIWLAESEEPAYEQAFDITFTWRWMHETSTNIGKLTGQHFKEFLQEYDTIKGLRLYFTSNHDENSWNGTEYEKYGEYALMLAVFGITYKMSIPLIYSGQEIPNLKRLKFFDKDELQWSSGATLHNFYTALLSLRSHHPAFGSEAYFEFLECDYRLMAFRKWIDDREVVTILNFSGDEVLFDSYNLSGFTDLYDAKTTKSQVFIQPAGYKVFFK